MVSFCPNCKREVASDDVFCGNCGHSLLTQPFQNPPKPVTEFLREAPVVPQPTTVAEPEVVSEPPPASEPVVVAEEAPPVIWVCSQCNSENPDSAEYCDTCGAMRENSALTTAELIARANKLPTEELHFAPPLIRVMEGNGTHPGWRFKSASATNEGLSRRGNADEDSVFALEIRRIYEARPESLGFYVVADGMGGQAAGEVASKDAIHTMNSIVIRDIVTPWLDGKNFSKDEVGQTLKIALQEAHANIKKYNAEREVDSGTTATVCCVIDNLLVCANVGDSRTYLWRAVPETAKEVHPAEINATAKTVKLKKIDKATLAIEQAQFKIERVSRDQSLVQDLYDQGIITLEQVYTDNRRNVVLSALGSPEETVPVDIYDRELRTGDRVLLVSDGLWEMVRDQVIAEQVATNPDLDIAADKLISLANQNGGVDNVSVVLVEVAYK